MSSRRELVTYVVEQLGPRVRFKAMFGEYGIYRDDTLIALFCDDRLFLKRSEAGYAFLGDDAEEAPPYPGAKPLVVVPEERWDDADFMRALADATARGLLAPSPAKKAARKKTARKAKPRT
jgi:TfoX/Sxy family transcriptional regulator of competence genes